MGMKTIALWSLLTIPALAHESDIWEWTLESGYLWNVGHNTEIDYEIIPTQLTLRSPVAWTLWEDEAGAKLVVRNQFSALFESITKGPVLVSVAKDFGVFLDRRRLRLDQQLGRRTRDGPGFYVQLV